MTAGHSDVAVAGIMFLAACAGPSGDVLVSISGHEPLQGTSVLEGTAPTTVEVGEFQQPIGTGVLPGRIGERKTVGDISLGLVAIEPPPSRLVREAFAVELKAAGHRQIGSDAAALLEGEVQRFDLRTDVTALYWDVIVNAAVSTTLKTETGEQRSDYFSTCKERSYTFPGNDVIARVVFACVKDLSDQFRNDESIAQLLADSS